MAWLQHLTLHGIVFVTTTGRSQAITSHTGSNILRGVVRRNERVYQAIFCSGLRDVSDGGHVLRREGRSARLRFHCWKVGGVKQLKKALWAIAP
jgi:hypothetical protein